MPWLHSVCDMDIGHCLDCISDTFNPFSSYNVDIGRCLDCIPFVIWILIIALAVSQTLIMCFFSLFFPYSWIFILAPVKQPVGQQFNVIQSLLFMYEILIICCFSNASSVIKGVTSGLVWSVKYLPLASLWAIYQAAFLKPFFREKILLAPTATSLKDAYLPYVLTHFADLSYTCYI